MRDVGDSPKERRRSRNLQVRRLHGRDKHPTGFHPVWARYSSRVVLIFYVHFAPAGLLFFRNLFSPFFFVTSHDILQKKDPSSSFFFVRVCESLIIVARSYDTNNNRKIIPLRHFLFSCRPQLSRQPTGAQGSASAAESIPILEGGSARAKRGVGLAGVRA
jgi:hypothetical protein